LKEKMKINLNESIGEEVNPSKRKKKGMDPDEVQGVRIGLICN